MNDDELFSRLVKVESLPRDGLSQKIRADEAERAALAKFLGLARIDELGGEFVIKRSGRGVRVTGRAHANVTYTCVVSLEEFPGAIDEEVEARFLPEGAKPPKRAASEEAFSLEEEDEPEAIVDGRIDLGRLAAEFVALGVDPYPRKPDAEFDSPGERSEKTSPFASLEGLAKGKK